MGKTFALIRNRIEVMLKLSKLCTGKSTLENAIPVFFESQPWMKLLDFIVVVATLNDRVSNFQSKVNKISKLGKYNEYYMIKFIHQGKWKIIGSKGQDHEVCSSQLLWSEKHYRYHCNKLWFSSKNITIIIVKHYHYHCKMLSL